MTQPEFNFNGVSRRWMKKWLRVNNAIQAAEVLVVAPGRDNLTESEALQLRAQQAQASADMMDAIDERDELIAEVLVSVPRDWLDADAPDDLDWSEPETQNWILLSKQTDFMAALIEGLQSPKKTPNGG